MHHFGRFDPSTMTTPPEFDGHSGGYRQRWLVNHATGSVHTGLSINELAPGGRVDPHVHAFEESFYILSGEAVFTINGTSWALRAGDYGTAKVGTTHSWHAQDSSPVRWLQMASPQPKPAGADRDAARDTPRDTFFPRDRSQPTSASHLDLTHLKDSLLGHFDAGQIPPPGQRQGAGQGLEGVFLKWLVDESFGAIHHRLLFIEYQPGVSIARHDHTFEEAYFILEGQVQGTCDGQTYVAGPGDFFWTGVGCVHTFVNNSNAPVRWLETFSPQPPRDNVFRFMADWEKRASALEE
jgi:quercetin dioxygenase-like cupin family protein